MQEKLCTWFSLMGYLFYVDLSAKYKDMGFHWALSQEEMSSQPLDMYAIVCKIFYV